MPRKPKSPCRYPGCPRLCEGRYCEEHTTKVNYEYNNRQRDPNTYKRYGSGWKAISKAYKEKHPLCEDCLKEGRYVASEEVHHIVALRNGGTHSFSNLKALCKSCHSRYTLEENRGRG